VEGAQPRESHCLPVSAINTFPLDQPSHPAAGSTAPTWDRRRLRYIPVTVPARTETCVLVISKPCPWFPRRCIQIANLVEGKSTDKLAHVARRNSQVEPGTNCCRVRRRKRTRRIVVAVGASEHGVVHRYWLQRIDNGVRLGGS